MIRNELFSKGINTYIEDLKHNYRHKMFKQFLEAYPDVKADEIPREVWLKVNNGIPLLYAYENYLRNTKRSV
jgi:hypothetical protein